MAERPALFSGSMVRANRAGLKWQTRRIMKPQPEHLQHHEWRGKVVYDEEHRMWCWKDQIFENIWDFPGNEDRRRLATLAPWKIGDTIWVRETFAPSVNGPLYRADPMFDGMKPGDFAWRWKPSLHMPRWASRDSYVITDVRVERLQDITAEDVNSEGVTESLMDEVLAPWARKVNALPEHWIHGADEALSYCRPCAEKAIKRLRKENPSGEYMLDGGWATEGDSQASCCNCRCILDNSYTDYACEAEVGDWGEYGFVLCSENALSLQNILGAVGFSGETGPQVKRFCFAALFDAVNGPGSWSRNPWVWVYTYDNPACKG